MTSSATLEYRRDFTGEQHYASRNSGDLRHVHEQSAANQSEVDWSVTLRQRRQPLPQISKSASAPSLRTEGLRTVDRSLTEPHEEGPYHGSTDTVGKYQNLGNTAHMLGGLVRVSSGSAQGIDWQLNLRDGYHQKPDDKWRKFHTRPQVSFDMMKENCSAKNDAYQASRITPQDRRPDRNMGAVPCANLRADPLSYRRWPGCEGTDVGQWRHLIEDTSKGRKSKRHLAFETTLREEPGDDRGSRICDNRSQGCQIEMLGKKKWHFATRDDPITRRPRGQVGRGGDPKLHYFTTHKIVAEPDEADREYRKSKRQWPRKDADIPEARPEI